MYIHINIYTYTIYINTHMYLYASICLYTVFKNIFELESNISSYFFIKKAHACVDLF